MIIKKEHFGQTGGRDVNLFTMESDNIRVEVVELAALVRAIYVKGTDGIERNVVLGMSTLEGYERQNYFLGAVIGRHANRIEGGEVVLQGVKYDLEKNDGDNNLHSGKDGFHNRVFTGSIVGGKLRFTYSSPDMEQSFPGNMDVAVTYSITPENGLLIEYQAVSDRDTVCNLTNHSYFNLEGEGKIMDHELTLAADFYTPLTSGGVPDGEILSVTGTPFDFTAARRIGLSIEAGESPVENGYDHNFVLRETAGGPCALVCAPVSGIRMEVYTDMPGVQFYSGNFLVDYVFPNGKEGGKRSALCLETQYFPNAFKYPHFEKPVLRSGEIWRSYTEYRFSLS